MDRSRFLARATAVAASILSAAPRAGDGAAAPLHLRVPPGLSVLMPVPTDNPLSAAKVALGHALFFDKQLSRDRKVACASCHRPERAFADGRRVPVGIGGRRGRRNVPSLLNRVYASALFWDGRAASLEEQALAPLVSALELDNSYHEIVRRLEADRAYRDFWREAFGTDRIAIDEVAQALASFERTLLSGNSAFDRYESLHLKRALSEPARRGLALFRGKAGCQVCHDGPLLSDGRFHNTGVSWGRQPMDLGRYEVTGLEPDRGAFRTPSLRDVARTAPYMHDGSLQTLGEVIDVYDRGGRPNPYLDGLLKPLGLTRGEKKDLVAFLKSLTGG